MKRRHVVLLLVVALSLLVFGAIGCGGDDNDHDRGPRRPTLPPSPDVSTDTTTGAPTGDPIVFGAVLSATGPGSPLGEPERATLGMMETQINDAGGVLGRPIKIVIEDDQTNPKEAVTAVNKLLQQDKVVAVLGSSTLRVHVGHEADHGAGGHPADGPRGVERDHCAPPSRGPGGCHRATLSPCRMPSPTSRRS